MTLHFPLAVDVKTITQDLGLNVFANYKSLTSNGANLSTCVMPPSLELVEIFLGPEIEVKYWKSSWGNEWIPCTSKVIEKISFSSTSGRSSNNIHPFIILNDGITVLVIAIAWSGNWEIELVRLPNNQVRIIAGLPFDSVSCLLKSDASMLTPIVYTSRSKDSVDDATSNLIQSFRNYKTSPLTTHEDRLLTEWNPWWPYEDVLIDEKIFLENAKIAAQAGVEVAVLDAGWFGPSGSDNSWVDYRGDWRLINEKRFPMGLAKLAIETRKLGLKFGIWIEIEAVGNKSELRKSNPDFLALSTRSDGEVDLGYICFANPFAKAWAIKTLISLISETKSDWVKIDFNIDPGLGCNRENHGHSSSDGLYLHVLALYKIIDVIKKEFPDLVIENCSSGGLRWDLGIALVADLGFTSDQDWPAHALSTFWASSQFFPVEQLLGWCDSEWRGDNKLQKFNIQNSNLNSAYFDFIFTISLLGVFGLSQRLIDFPIWAIERLKFFTNFYKIELRPRYKSNPKIIRLTSQPIADSNINQVVVMALESENYSPLLFCFNLGTIENTVSLNYFDKFKIIHKVGLYNLLNSTQLITSNKDSISLKPNSAAIIGFVKEPALQDQ